MYIIGKTSDRYYNYLESGAAVTNKVSNKYWLGYETAHCAGIDGCSGMSTENRASNTGTGTSSKVHNDRMDENSVSKSEKSVLKRRSKTA